MEGQIQAGEIDLGDNRILFRKISISTSEYRDVDSLLDAMADRISSVLQTPLFWSVINEDEAPRGNLGYSTIEGELELSMSKELEGGEC